MDEWALRQRLTVEFSVNKDLYVLSDRDLMIDELKCHLAVARCVLFGQFDQYFWIDVVVKRGHFCHLNPVNRGNGFDDFGNGI
ncbi:hypothetical protein GJ633_03570 [Halorubrum sp. CBA1125]|nr:hypothetical protein [Halorubrum sp. CBA1125]MUW13845.1 hypothetical protein [Halorubrum sp. CBA1125]